MHHCLGTEISVIGNQKDSRELGKVEAAIQYFVVVYLEVKPKKKKK